MKGHIEAANFFLEDLDLTVYNELLDKNQNFKDINMFVNTIRRQMEREEKEEYTAEDKHAMCENELIKILGQTEGVPIIKIVDIVRRNGFY